MESSYVVLMVRGHIPHMNAFVPRAEVLFLRYLMGEVR